MNIPATTDSDVEGWNVYVDPPPAGATASEDGGTASTPAAETCVSSVLATNVDAGAVGSDVPARYLAAQVSAKSTQATVSGLVPGVAYTVAVAAFDAAGNVGPLAVAPCGKDSTPIAGAAGSSRGGSSCALAAPGAPAGSAAIAGAGILGLVAAGRRRRRTSSTTA